MSQSSRSGRSLDQVASYEAQIAAVVELLLTQSATAKDIAEVFGRQSMKAVYSWLWVLKERGFRLKKRKVATGSVGPRVAFYSIEAE